MDVLRDRKITDSTFYVEAPECRCNCNCRFSVNIGTVMENFMMQLRCGSNHKHDLVDAILDEIINGILSKPDMLDLIVTRVVDRNKEIHGQLAEPG